MKASLFFESRGGVFGGTVGHYVLTESSEVRRSSAQVRSPITTYISETGIILCISDYDELRMDN